ncbi:MAG: pilus assembly protein [Acidimicrobiia bacterium]|nr:pilus assembly protein [Acidimicrobiia bacterium]
MVRLRQRARDGERGAVLIEFAIVAMLLATMGFGILEYGYGWRSSMNVLTAARAGARSVSSSGTDYLSDYLALTSIRTNLDSEGMLSGLQRVVIYRSPADGKPPARCAAGAPQASDFCNVYTASEVQLVAASQFNTGTGCKNGSSTSYYCPSTRITAQGSADSIGVWVQAKQKALTGFFGLSGFTASRTAVMRMEP